MLRSVVSKICPSCGAKNPSSAYSCSNCAASLIDMSTPSFQSSQDAGGSTQQGHIRTSSSSDRDHIQNMEAIRSPGYPMATVRQSPFRSIINALITMAFILVFGLSAGFATGGALVSLAVILAIIVIPLLLGFVFRPKFEFYDTHLLRVSRSSSRKIDYSEIQLVEKNRSAVRIALKPNAGERFRFQPILVPGNPKLSDGTDLADWLKSKIIPHQDHEEESVNDAPEKDLGGIDNLS